MEILPQYYLQLPGPPTQPAIQNMVTMALLQESEERES
jgi:hypothetical protein